MFYNGFYKNIKKKKLQFSIINLIKQILWYNKLAEFYIICKL